MLIPAHPLSYTSRPPPSLPARTQLRVDRMQGRDRRDPCWGRTPGNWSKCEEWAGWQGYGAGHLPGTVKDTLLPIVPSTTFLPSLVDSDGVRVWATPSPELLTLERTAKASGPTNTSIDSLFQDQSDGGSGPSPALSSCVSKSNYFWWLP